MINSNSNNHNEKCKKDETVSTENTKMSKKASSAAQTFSLSAKEKKTIFRMLSIVGFLCLTSVPFIFILAYEIRRGHDQIIVKYLYPWAKTINFVNGVINPFLYYHGNEHFRKRQPMALKSPSASTSCEHAQSRYELPFRRNK